MKTLLFLLEEPSAKDLLQGLLPRLLPATVAPEFLVFEGKQDLERNVARKIRGWQRPDTCFVILRDQDAGDCLDVKRRLVELVPASHRGRTVVRVACRELESWILGDWPAVATAFEAPRLGGNRDKRAYRAPDQLANPVQELRKFLPAYQKRDGARRLGVLLDPERNCSHSFRVFCDAVRALAG
jgi:hypothetical protein